MIQNEGFEVFGRDLALEISVEVDLKRVLSPFIGCFFQVLFDSGWVAIRLSFFWKHLLISLRN